MRFHADLPEFGGRPDVAAVRRASAEPVRVTLESLAIERTHVAIGRALAQLARRRDDAIEAGRHEVLTESAGPVVFTVEV